MEIRPNKLSNEVLVVDTNYSRGQSFVAVLAFMKVEAGLVTPEDLAKISSEGLHHYLAIFSIETEATKQYFLERNKADTCQYPVVLMVDRSDANADDIVVQPPYTRGLCFQSDYYALSRVLDQSRIHNHKERRVKKT